MQKKHAQKSGFVPPHGRTALLFLCLFLCLWLLFYRLPVGVSAEASPVPDLSRASAVLLYNLDYGLTVIEKNADTVRPPASTVKIMTGLLLSELLDTRMEETVTVTEAMVKNTTGVQMKLQAGEKLSVSSLYYAAVCGGYNDACTALAVYAAGSVEDFVALMNEKAAALGMTSTVYQNPTGLHAAAMVTTARDTLRLSCAAIANERFLTVSSTVKTTIPATNLSEARTFYNRNALIASNVTTAYYNAYAKGLNAGMTSEGGYCLSTLIGRNGLSWVCVVLGGDEGEDGTIYSYTTANNLASYAARTYESRKIVTEGTRYATIPVEYAKIGEKVGDGIALVAATSLETLVPKSSSEDGEGLKYHVRLYASSLTAPVKERTEAGFLIVTFDGTEIGRVMLITKDDIARDGFVWMLSLARDLWKNRTFVVSFLTFCILLTLYMFRVLQNRPRRARASRGFYVPIPFRNAGGKHSPPPNPRGNSNHSNSLQKAPPRTPPSPARPPEDPYQEAYRVIEHRRKAETGAKKPAPPAPRPQNGEKKQSPPKAGDR